jgi:hypothetical protein
MPPRPALGAPSTDAPDLRMRHPAGSQWKDLPGALLLQPELPVQCIQSHYDHVSPFLVIGSKHLLQLLLQLLGFLKHNLPFAKNRWFVDGFRLLRTDALAPRLVPRVVLHTKLYKGTSSYLGANNGSTDF